MQTPEKLKRCPACTRELPLEAYRNAKGRPQGVDSYCKRCRREKDRANRERENKRISKWRMEHPEARVNNQPKEATNARAMARRHNPKPGRCSLGNCTNRGELHHYLGATKEHALDVVRLCRKHHSAQHLLEKARARTGPAWM